VVTPTASHSSSTDLVWTGYAQRVRDPADRRRVLVEAAEPARRFADEVWGEVVMQTEQQLEK
jgi:DNA-binding MarR family transcriptional regulator